MFAMLELARVPSHTLQENSPSFPYLPSIAYSLSGRIEGLCESPLSMLTALISYRSVQATTAAKVDVMRATFL